MTKGKLLCRFLLGLVLLFGFEAKAADFRPDRIMVLPKADRATDNAKLHKQKGHKVKKKFANIGGLEVIQLAPGQDVLAAIKEYQQSGAVEFAEPDYLFHPTAIPNDPSFNLQWH